MKLQYKFLWSWSPLLLLFFTTIITSCTNERSTLLEEEGYPITLQINYSAPMEADENPLRAAITPYEEYKVHNLFIFIVDGSGDIVDRQFFNYNDLKDKKEHPSGTPDTTEGNVQISTTTGMRKVYAIANVANGISSILDISKQALSNENSIKTEGDLNNLFANLSTNTLSRINGRLLMSGTSDKVSLSSSMNSIDVELIRVTAKVTFTINAAEGITFIPQTWAVHRVPKKVSVFPTDDPHGRVNNGSDFFDADKPRVFEGDAHLGEAANSFTYYQLENLKPAKGNPTSRKEREKQVKEHQNNGKAKNGAWVNAPDNGTYVVLTGRYERTEDDGRITRADVKYTIHLGYLDSNPADYSCKRNTHYHYTVTVKGVEDIIVEARNEHGTTEPDTGAEGMVTRGPKKYVFDAHFVQFVAKFHKDALRMAMLNSFEGGYFTPKKMYKVSTPYGADDIGWVEFVRNTDMSKKEQVALYPGRGHTSLQNVEEMFQDLSKNINNASYFDSEGYVYYTVFVNEYFYEDKDFWGFVNKPDRSMKLAIGGDNYISYDNMSEFSEDQYGIWQKSIKTGYPEGQPNALGFETFDESYGTPFEYDPTPANTLFIGINTRPHSNRPVGNSPDDGWFNSVTSWYLIRVGGHTVENYEEYARTSNYWTNANWKFRRWDNYVDLNQVVTSDNTKAESWGTYVLVKDGVENKYKKGSDKYASYNRARYACLSRNRDLNGNGMIDKDEVRWYMPAEDQLTGIWQVSSKINREDQMYREPSYYRNNGKIRYVHYLSSTIGEQPNTEEANWRNNLRVLWSEEGNSISNLSSSKEWVGVKENQYYNRCVRTLNNTNEPYAKVGVPSDYNKELRVIKVLQNGSVDINNYRDVNLDYLTGEYPPHSERSPFNRPASSFQVAKDWITSAGDRGIDWHSRNNKDWGCGTYSEKPNKSDRGQWRVPNQRELQLMTQYDLVGEYTDEYLSGLGIHPRDMEQHRDIRVWSSTFFSNAPDVNPHNQPRAFMGASGIALQQQRYKYRDGKSSSNGIPVPGFKLRCVRDYPTN